MALEATVATGIQVTELGMVVMAMGIMGIITLHIILIDTMLDRVDMI